MPASPLRDPLYRGYRFPAEIISHAAWLYSRFHLSHRDIEDLLAERGVHGVQVSDEAIRLWCCRFGPALAAGLRRHRRRAGGKWHLDEVQLKIKGKKHRLWRAVDQVDQVDQVGEVLDILVQDGRDDRRDQYAAERFLRRVLDRVLDGQEQAPRGVVTDKRASYPPALRRVLPGVEHRRHKGLNNRAENSHRPVRKRERVLQRFCCSASSRQGTPSASSNPSAPSRTTSAPAATSSPQTRRPAEQYRQIRTERFGQWREAARLHPAA